MRSHVQAASIKEDLHSVATIGSGGQLAAPLAGRGSDSCGARAAVSTIENTVEFRLCFSFFSENLASHLDGKQIVCYNVSVFRISVQEAPMKHSTRKTRWLPLILALATLMAILLVACTEGGTEDTTPADTTATEPVTDAPTASP